MQQRPKHQEGEGGVPTAIAHPHRIRPEVAVIRGGECFCECRIADGINAALSHNEIPQIVAEIASTRDLRLTGNTKESGLTPGEDYARHGGKDQEPEDGEPHPCG